MKLTPGNTSAQQALRSIRSPIRLALFLTALLFLFVGAHSLSQATPIITVSYADKVNEPVVFMVDNATATSLATFDDGYVEWDFGDGFKAKIVRATHVYRAAGTYTVKFTGKLANGGTAMATKTVTISDIPAATQDHTLCVRTSLPQCSATYTTVQGAVDRAAESTMSGTGPVEIILPAGQIFDDGMVTLTPPPATSNNYITIKSSQLADLPQGKRVDRSNVSTAFATMYAPNNLSAVHTVNGDVRSHHYRFQGIQFKTKPGVSLIYFLVELGRNDSSQATPNQIPHHLIVDRCLFYSDDASDGLNETSFGLSFNATNSSVVDSHFSNLAEYSPTHGSSAIGVGNTVGVLGIVNNYLESSSLNVIFGGSIPTIPAPNNVIRDVEFRRNRCHKPIEKRGAPYNWPSENNFETKSAQYFVIEGNLFDTSWNGGSINSPQRWLVNLRVINDSGSSSILKDIQFTSNKLKQGPNGIFLAGKDTTTPVDGADRVLITNNLMEDIDEFYGLPNGQTYGQDFTISNGVPANLVIRHNTLFNSYALMGVGGPDMIPALRRPIIFNDNIGPHSQQGIWGDSKGSGNPAINYYFPSSTILKNVIVGATASNYPPNNFFPTDLSAQFVNLDGGDYHLSSSSPGKGAASENDGSDVGADIDTLEAATKGTISGDWSAVTGENVTWINFGGGAAAPAPGDTLTKSSGTTGWNAGAISAQTLSGGEGYVEFSTNESDKSKICGLSYQTAGVLNEGQSYQEIEYALHLRNDGSVLVFESGTNKGVQSSYVAGDKFRVTISGGAILYYQKLVSGSFTTFYTHGSATLQYPMVVDTSLYHVGATITDASLVPTTADVWVQGVGVSISGDMLTKTGVTAWNAGAISAQTLASGEGYAEFSTNESDKGKICGLSYQTAGVLNEGQSYQEIEYALHLRNDGSVLVFESGTNKGVQSSYVAGDKFRVTIANGAILYQKLVNGSFTTFYTHSNATLQYPMVVDTSLYSTGATIKGLTLDGAWN